MVEERERVQRTLPVGKLFGQFAPVGNSRATVATGIGKDELILALEVLASGVDPVGVASGAAVEEKQRCALSTKLVVEGGAVGGNGGFGGLRHRSSVS